jgi:transcriptional regulator with XRE-family HTH domain
MDTLSVLKRRRQELNMTQAEVAKAVGVSQPTYQNYEAGTIAIPPTKLKRLAKALRLTTDEIPSRSKVSSPLVSSSRQRIKPEPSIAQGEGQFDVDTYGDPLDYWGDIAIHFTVGQPLVLAISHDQHKRLFALVQGHAEFLPVYSMSNQIVGVRRAAITDLSFAHEVILTAWRTPITRNTICAMGYGQAIMKPGISSKR